MSRAASPFSPRVVLGLVAVGAAAFLLFLYALGAGWTGGERAMGSGHAASKGLNGYAGLVDLLDRRGHEVSLSRTPGRLDEEALLVLTPPHFADADDLEELLEERRWQGPTILILPKWFGFEAAMAGIEDAPRGWVVVGDAEEAEWAEDLSLGTLDARIGEAAGWRAAGRSGALAAPKQSQTIFGSEMARLVGDGRGGALAAYRDDGGSYEMLEDFSARTPPDPAIAAREAAPVLRVAPPVSVVLDPAPGDEPGADDEEEFDDGEYYDDPEDYWPLVIVAEPDLFNNAGMADAERARLAVELVDAAIDGYDLPIVFDLTLPGLGRSENLLTLAFEPPFLAATLTLLLAALVSGWRAFVRFGPTAAELPAFAGGKAQLARDGSALIERARRLRLVGPPYAALVEQRIARMLGLPETANAETRAAAIARALGRRGEDPETFARACEALRQARRPADLLRAARALKTIERTFAR